MDIAEEIAKRVERLPPAMQEHAIGLAFGKDTVIES